jgi:hypothetical protein
MMFAKEIGVMTAKTRNKIQHLRNVEQMKQRIDDMHIIKSMHWDYVITFNTRQKIRDYTKARVFEFQKQLNRELYGKQWRTANSEHERSVELQSQEVFFVHFWERGDTGHEHAHSLCRLFRKKASRDKSDLRGKGYWLNKTDDYWDTQRKIQAELGKDRTTTKEEVLAELGITDEAFISIAKTIWHKVNRHDKKAQLWINHWQNEKAPAVANYFTKQVAMDCTQIPDTRNLNTWLLEQKAQQQQALVRQH